MQSCRDVENDSLTDVARSFSFRDSKIRTNDLSVCIIYPYTRRYVDRRRLRYAFATIVFWMLPKRFTMRVNSIDNDLGHR